MKIEVPGHEYTRGELRLRDLHPDPLEQFARWFGEACDAKVVEPNAMCLATAGADGWPMARTVLLKSYDSRGFVFYTNLESGKARQIAENPKASLLFAWLSLERQIIISGTVEKVSTAETLQYFMTRPRGSQVGAWVSCQSSVLSSRAVLEMKWEQMKQKFAQGQVPLPSWWGGYRVAPRQVEFWQGRPHRLHDRFLYSRQGDGAWVIERLAP